jgi:hypothetical protein
MILGIMQPYFFPYLGYFDLINRSDRWIVFDTAQYIRHGWINRNRVLHPKEGWIYITVPVRKCRRGTAIKDVEINGESEWAERVLGRLTHYRGRAPYYEETFQLVRECVGTGERPLSRLIVAAIERVCDRIGIGFRYDYLSEMDLHLGPVEGPGDWALRISEALGAEEYVNPSGGAALFEPGKFEKSGIRLNIRDLPHLEYSCGKYQFIPGLSIVDVLMWVPPEKVMDYLMRHK